MSKIGKILILSASILILLKAEQTFAQFTSTIGTATFNGQTFSCRTYTDKQDIFIITNGKSKTVSKTAAQKQAQKTIEKISDRIKNLAGTIKDKNARLKKLLKQNIPTDAVVKEIVKLQAEIPKLSALIDQNKAQQAELKAIITGIKNCGKGPQIGNGSNAVYSVTTTLPKTGRKGYIMIAAHVFPVDDKDFPNRFICVSKGGGPFTQMAFKIGVCTIFHDGLGFENPTTVCAPTPPGTGAIYLDGGFDYFSSGKYDQHVAAANAAVNTVVKIKAAANGTC